MTDNYLSLKRIGEEIACPYSVLRRYITAGVGELIGGVRVKGETGLRFPEASLPRWRTVAHLHRSRAIVPATAVQALPIFWGLTSEAQEASSTPLAPEEPSTSPCGDVGRVLVMLERIAVAVEKKRKRKRKR